ncbi:hypothetical protein CAUPRSCDRAFT_13085 [Caulochytrium protostelioides]|nr:hypothetical protein CAUPRSCDRAFT_13085 [Caulochytrium protostelioides]
MDVPVGHAYEVHGFGASRSEMELLLYTRNTTGAPDALLVLRLSSRQWERHTGVAGLTSAGTSPAASPGGSPAGSSGMLAAARSLLTGGSSTPAQNSSDPRLAGGPTVIVPAIETKTDYRGVQQSAAKVLVKALR